MYWYTKVMKQAFDFNTRARRKEYWMFFLMNFLIALGIGFVLGVLSKVLGMPNLVLSGQIYNVIVFIPSLAVATRRVHDSDYKVWWLLVPIFNFYLLIKEGDAAANRYGADPKVAERNQQHGGGSIA